MSFKQVVEKARAVVERAPGAQEQTTRGPEAIRRELEFLRDRNLDEASFEQKFDMIARLGIEVYPAEDLRSKLIASS